MTSRILRQIQRDPKFRKQPEPPAPAPLNTSALNNAIGELIRQAAAAGAEEAIKQQPTPNPAVPAHRRDFTDKAESHEFPPPPPTTAPPRDFTMHIQRDELGRIKTFTVGSDAKFELQRNGEGKTVRVVKLD